MKIANRNPLKSQVSSIFIVLAFIAAFNFLVSQNSSYLDLTEEKIYTTSEASKDILRNLSQEVKVNFYISKDLPVNLLAVKTQLVDFMNQYQDIAGSKLKVSYNEPENSPEKAQELAGKGIPQLQFNVVEKDKYEVKQGFFGAEIVSGEGEKEKRESIPMIQSVDNWEYDFISTVYSVSREKKEIIAFLSGHNEKELQVSELGKSYEMANVKLETEGEQNGFYAEKEIVKKNEKGEDKTEIEKIFVNPITLVIAGPSTKVSEKEISIIDSFIKNGGNVIVLSESVNIDNNLKTEEVDSGLNELMKKYGIEVNNDLVYDVSNASITYQQGYFTVSKPYPLWVKANKDNFSNNPSLSEIQSLTFPWVSSIAINENIDYVASPLISSTDKANTISGSFDVVPDRTFSFNGGSKKILAAVSKPKDENSKSGKLFAIGDSDFISFNFSRQVSDNQTFFLNLVD